LTFGRDFMEVRRRRRNPFFGQTSLELAASVHRVTGRSEQERAGTGCSTPQRSCAIRSRLVRSSASVEGRPAPRTKRGGRERRRRASNRESPGRAGPRPPETAGWRYGPVRGARPRGRGPRRTVAQEFTLATAQASRRRSHGGQRRGGRRAQVTALRLRNGGALRGVVASRETVEARRRRRKATRGGAGKRGEPQDRRRDATSPPAVSRRKPSRW